MCALIGAFGGVRFLASFFGCFIGSNPLDTSLGIPCMRHFVFWKGLVWHTRGFGLCMAGGFVFASLAALGGLRIRPVYTGLDLDDGLVIVVLPTGREVSSRFCTAVNTEAKAKERSRTCGRIYITDSEPGLESYSLV